MGRERKEGKGMRKGRQNWRGLRRRSVRKEGEFLPAHI